MRKYVIIGLSVIVVAWIVVTVAVVHGYNTKPPITVKTTGSYVALGDSVAAGSGLETDSDPTACDRTKQAYPNVVAAHYHYSVVNLACAGAATDDGVLGDQDVNDLNVSGQLQRLFAMPRPQLITMTIGANDVGWIDYIKECYSGECGSAQDSSAIAQSLVHTKSRMETVLSKLQQHYGSDMPKVVVTGYYRVFPAKGSSCVDLTGIDSSEIAWTTQQEKNIDTTIQSAVSGYSFAKFASVDFSGHELCTGNSWLQGLNDNQPYHPNDVGQEQYAKSIEKALQS